MLIKSAVVGFVAYGAVSAIMPLIGGLVPISRGARGRATTRCSSLLRTVAVAGLVMAAADYVIVRRRMGKQTRMSKHEVKQESKQTEGDPLLKGAIRSRQLAASRNRMMADVPTADVVLVNPTHVAVALTYDAERGAPRVVARGAGLVAQRIREQAAEHGVPLVRDIPLARALHRSTTVGPGDPGRALRRRGAGAGLRDLTSLRPARAAASTAPRDARASCRPSPSPGAVDAGVVRPAEWLHGPARTPQESPPTGR